jgi:hypothetical protein
MENNTSSSNWKTQCPKWVRMRWIRIKLWVARNGNVLLLLLTAVLAYFAYLQYQSLEKQTKSLENQAVSLKKQTKSLELQTIAVKNSRENQPRINCSSSINSDGSINVVMVNGGAPFTYKTFEHSERCWVKVKVSHKEMLDPLPINSSLRDEVTPDEEETRWEKSFTVENPLNFAKILNEDTSKEIRIIPFVVIRVSYKDMFGKLYRVYYRIEGQEYPRPPWDSGWDDTGWGNTGWDSGEYQHLISNAFGKKYFKEYKAAEKDGKLYGEAKLSERIKELTKDTPPK